MGTSDLHQDEVAANRCFEKHGLRITRENGRFELRGDINAGQDAYLDPACKALIGPAVRERVETFLQSLDAEAVDCLRAKGYDVHLDGRIGFDPGAAPPEEVRRCFQEVYRKYA